MKPFEKPMERSSQYSLVISSTPGYRCVFSPVRFWPCTVLKIPINKHTFKNLFGCRATKGEYESQTQPRVCSCEYPTVWLFWQSLLEWDWECGANTKTCGMQMVKKKRQPGLLWLINMSTQSVCVLTGHRADGDETMCWKHLHYFLDFCCLQSSGLNTLAAGQVS